MYTRDSVALLLLYCFVACLLQVLQLPIVKNKLKKLLQSAVRKMALLGAPVIPSSDDPLDQFLQSAGKFFGKDPTRWEQMGEAISGVVARHIACKTATTML
jgi:hypothetical protein